MQALGPSNDKNIPTGELRLARRIASKEAATQKSNTRFHSLPRNKQRVEIAKDVLKALGEWLFAEPGTYLWHRRDYETRYSEVTEDGVTKCDVCALGAVFACAEVRQGRPVKSASSDTMVTRLEDYFTENELRTIEAAFEGFGVGTTPEATRATEAFNANVGTPQTRMARIMRNIIRNDGTFIP